MQKVTAHLTLTEIVLKAARQWKFLRFLFHSQWIFRRNEPEEEIKFAKSCRGLRPGETESTII